jgi:hypothetical protein
MNLCPVPPHHTDPEVKAAPGQVINELANALKEIATADDKMTAVMMRAIARSILRRHNKW